MTECPTGYNYSAQRQECFVCGWECTHINLTASLTVHQNNTLQVDFNASADVNQTLSTEVVSLSITGPYPTYSFSPVFEIGTNPVSKFYINLNLKTTIFGDGQEKVWLNFTNQTVFALPNTIYVQFLVTQTLNGTLFKKEFVDQEELNKMRVTGEVTASAIYGTVGLAVITSMIMGGAPFSFLVLMNVLQLVNLSPLLSI